jgi:hypothetical protein
VDSIIHAALDPGENRCRCARGIKVAADLARGLHVGDAGGDLGLPLAHQLGHHRLGAGRRTPELGHCCLCSR